MIVVDASIIASALGDDGPDGERARSRVAGERLFAPELVDLEVASAWRRSALARRLGGTLAREALADLAALPLARAPHHPFMSRIWELRENLTPYDAAYVALSEGLETTLLTADRRLTRAPGVHCEIELLR